MKLWISGEINHDVSDAYRHARKAVETAFNERYGGIDYGNSVDKWAYIAMIAPPPAFGYSEVQRYDENDRCLEFRLIVDHAAFLKGTPQEQEQLMGASLRRSLGLAETMRVPGFALDRLQHDFDRLAAERGWY